MNVSFVQSIDKTIDNNDEYNGSIYSAMKKTNLRKRAEQGLNMVTRNGIANKRPHFTTHQVEKPLRIKNR